MLRVRLAAGRVRPGGRWRASASSPLRKKNMPSVVMNDDTPTTVVMTPLTSPISDARDEREHDGRACSGHARVLERSTRLNAASANTWPTDRSISPGDHQEDLAGGDDRGRRDERPQRLQVGRGREVGDRVQEVDVERDRDDRDAQLAPAERELDRARGPARRRGLCAARARGGLRRRGGSPSRSSGASSWISFCSFGGALEARRVVDVGRRRRPWSRTSGPVFDVAGAGRGRPTASS